MRGVGLIKRNLLQYSSSLIGVSEPIRDKLILASIDYERDTTMKQFRGLHITPTWSTQSEIPFRTRMLRQKAGQGTSRLKLWSFESMPGEYNWISHQRISV